jgi:hypothetical protein
MVVLQNNRQNLILAPWRVYLDTRLVLDIADPRRQSGSLIRQLKKFAVKPIDLLP